MATALSVTGGVLSIAGNLTFTSGAVALTNTSTLKVGGNFSNLSGYTTTQTARIRLVGAANTFGGAGSFGTIEFNNATPGTFTASSNVTLTGTIYLTAGAVANGGNVITINNTTVLPTVVLNAGTFSQAPTYSSNVNISYIGTDKTTGNEIPTVASKLQNLTIATTTGVSKVGYGIVTLGANATVNGIITVNRNQTLSIANGFVLTMKGATISISGNIINVGSGYLSLAAATGTTITGSGYLPPISIAAGSVGNSINATAIVNQFLGASGLWTDGAVFVPTTTSANGSLTFVSGTNSATVTLSGVSFDGSMLGAVTTASTGNTLTLGGNLAATGTLTHAGGTINVGTFTFEQRGASVNIGQTGTASFAGSGLFRLYQKDGATDVAFTLTAGGTGSTIGVNTEFNNADVTTADPAEQIVLAGAPLTISGNLTLTAGKLNLGENLTLTGSAFTITSGSVTGASTLRLDAAVAPLTFTYSGTPTIANLRISNDVNLAGTGTALTITTLFTHDGGVLNFGSENLTFQTAFTRTAGSYKATTGYMILDGSSAYTVSQGSDGFSIPNLRVTASAANNVSLTGGTGGGIVTVTNAFDLKAAAQTFTTNSKLAIADSATVNYTSGNVDVVPAYSQIIKLVALNVTSGGTIPALIWPATATLVSSFQVNSAAAANTVLLPGSRQVNSALWLTEGTLTIGANTLTLNSKATIHETDLGSVTVGATGNLVFPSDNSINLSYESTGGAITTSIEFPAIMNNLTVTRTGNVANSVLTIGMAATVNGTLSIRNNITASSALTAMGPVTIATDANSQATVPNCIFHFRSSFDSCRCKYSNFNYSC